MKRNRELWALTATTPHGSTVPGLLRSDHQMQSSGKCVAMSWSQAIIHTPPSLCVSNTFRRAIAFSHSNRGGTRPELVFTMLRVGLRGRNLGRRPWHALGPCLQCGDTGPFLDSGLCHLFFPHLAISLISHDFHPIQPAHHRQPVIHPQNTKMKTKTTATTDGPLSEMCAFVLCLCQTSR